MNNDLKSSSWQATMEAIRECHLSLLTPDSADVNVWNNAFGGLVDSIKNERSLDPAFCPEFQDLDQATGSSYSFADILEEYFDFLEDKEKWDQVISSCRTLISLFKWEKAMPSEYMYRIGNALEQAKRFNEAESFGKEWLDKYPTDLYAAASNVYLMLELKKYKEAEALTEKYLRDDLICDSDSDTFFMAAYRLYELTDNINAKLRVEKRMSDYTSKLQDQPDQA